MMSKKKTMFLHYCTACSQPALAPKHAVIDRRKANELPLSDIPKIF